MPLELLGLHHPRKNYTFSCCPALSGPVLRDTARLSQRYPPIARYGGFWCLNITNWVRYPLPLFWAFPPFQNMRSGGAIPPFKRGISAILARYPMKTRQKGAIPPSAILSRKGIARYGGVSRTGPLRSRLGRSTPPITPEYSQRINWRNKFHLYYTRKFSAN